jgi:hypothetical protein
MQRIARQKTMKRIHGGYYLIYLNSDGVLPGEYGERKSVFIGCSLSCRRNKTSTAPCSR